MEYEAPIPELKLYYFLCSVESLSRSQGTQKALSLISNPAVYTSLVEKKYRFTVQGGIIEPIRLIWPRRSICNITYVRSFRGS